MLLEFAHNMKDSDKKQHAQHVHRTPHSCSGCGIGCDYDSSSHHHSENILGTPPTKCTHVDQPYQGQCGGHQFHCGGYLQQQPYQYHNYPVCMMYSPIQAG